MNQKSKYLSLLLRHKPENANLTLDAQGWCDVSELLHNTNISMEELEEVVANNDKKRFSFNEDKTKIRAAQGHSIKVVKIEMAEQKPPTILYHGTQVSNLDIIIKEGIKKMNRNHVHLSKDKETAEKVASRRKGDNIILSVAAMHMRAEGYKFYLSDNGVWLTEFVPAKFIVDNFRFTETSRRAC